MPMLMSAMVDDVVAVDRGVDHGHGAQRVHRRLDDERHVGELRAGRARTPPSARCRISSTRARSPPRRPSGRAPRCAGSTTMCSAILPAHDRHRHHLVEAPGDVGSRSRPWRRRGARWPSSRRCGLARRRGAAAAAAAACSMKPRMSCLVTRPAIPVPGIREMSTPCSFAILRTSGDELLAARLARSAARRPRRLRRRAPPVPPGRRGWSLALRRCRGPLGRASALRRSGGRRAAAAASPASPMVATTLLTGTVSPSLTLISVRTPAAGDGNLRVHLVGRDLEQRLVAIDRVAHLLDPADDGPLGDRLAHLRHDDVRVAH